MALSDVSRQARELSSGTISYLIEQRTYEAIEQAQQSFVAFIDRMDELAGRPTFRKWQDAWTAFQNSNA